MKLSSNHYYKQRLKMDLNCSQDRGDEKTGTLSLENFQAWYRM